MASKKPKEEPKKNVKGLHRVITIDSKDTFNKYVSEAGNKHVLVEFTATWCGPCRIIGPRLEELSVVYADKLIILKIDVDDHEDLALEYDISSMPTFLIIKNKVTLEQFVGSNSEKVETTLQKFCGKPEDGKLVTATAAVAAAATGAATTITGQGTSRMVNNAKAKDAEASDKKLSDKSKTKK